MRPGRRASPGCPKAPNPGPSPPAAARYAAAHSRPAERARGRPFPCNPRPPLKGCERGWTCPPRCGPPGRSCPLVPGREIRTRGPAALRNPWKCSCIPEAAWLLPIGPGKPAPVGHGFLRFLPGNGRRPPAEGVRPRHADAGTKKSAAVRGGRAVNIVEDYLKYLQPAPRTHLSWRRVRRPRCAGR